MVIFRKGESADVLAFRSTVEQRGSRSCRGRDSPSPDYERVSTVSHGNLQRRAPEGDWRCVSGDELFVRGKAKVDDPILVVQHLLPAAERKVEIVETMEVEHGAFHVPTSAKKAATAYGRWSEFITILLARARLQRDCIQEWSTGPFFDFWERSTALDAAEERSMNSAANDLNDLIERAGLAGDPWLSISCEAFNTVRNRIGLAALSETDFRGRFIQGMAGMRPRFFE